MTKQYKVRLECDECSPPKESEVFKVNIHSDFTWTFACGQKPKGWLMDDEAELLFYKDGKDCKPDKAEYGTIFALCPEHAKEKVVEAIANPGD